MYLITRHEQSSPAIQGILNYYSTDKGRTIACAKRACAEEQSPNMAFHVCRLPVASLPGKAILEANLPIVAVVTKKNNTVKVELKSNV